METKDPFDNDSDKTYIIPELMFERNAWRHLCMSFIEYISEIDITDSERIRQRQLDYDSYLLICINNVIEEAKNLQRIARFLIDVRPNDQDLNAWQSDTIIDKSRPTSKQIETNV